MFDFDKPEDGSGDRYQDRITTWRLSVRPNDKLGRKLAVIKHHGWWLLHNCIAHPLIGIIPMKFAFDFHDWTSRKLNGL